MSTGVYLHKKTGKYAAQINRDGLRYFLGLHPTEQAAADARAKFAATLPQNNPPASLAQPGLLTQERVRELFRYEAETGQLIWKARTSRRIKVGQPVSHLTRNGYLAARVDGRSYLAHRMVWLYVHGKFPDNELDHCDGNRTNNRLENLRAATRAQNTQNYPVRADNALGYTGVYKNRRSGRFDVELREGGGRRYRASFLSLNKAVAARAKAKAIFHSFQPTQRGA